MIEKVTKVSDLTKPTIRSRLDYLDGVRGLSALYVVLHHASDPSWAEGAPGSAFLAVRKLMVFGHFGVAVFIILSGYCLMLPVARSVDRKLRGGFKEYIRRRALRILPPYYAAVFLTLIMIKFISPLQHSAGNFWDAALPAFRQDVLLSHLFMVHNLSPQWYWKIDPPLWSVATEWQIYFFFPLLLLPLWRRFGLVAAVVTAFVLGLAPHFLLPPSYNLEAAVPWYLGLFALGMGAATINFAPDEEFKALRTRVPWGKLTAALFLFTLAFALVKAKWWWAHLWFADTQVGLFAACFLIYCTLELHRHAPNALLRLFQARGVVMLGTMSYSLYLMHAPMLALLYQPLHSLNISPTMRMWIMLIVVTPITIVLTYLFHLAFERRFISTHGAKTVQRAVTSIPSTAEIRSG